MSNDPRAADSGSSTGSSARVRSATILRRAAVIASALLVSVTAGGVTTRMPPDSAGLGALAAESESGGLVTHLAISVVGAALAEVTIQPPNRDEMAAPQKPPQLCQHVCERAEEKNSDNLRAACYSCRCAQIAGHPVTMDKASDTPRARTFILKPTPPPVRPGTPRFTEEFHPESQPYPASCVNPALLDEVDPKHACATGNRLGQAMWKVADERGVEKKVWAKWIWRKKAAAGNRFNDWGKIYHREDGFTCFFDDINDDDRGRDGDSLGAPGGPAMEYPALDLTWVVKFWQDRTGLSLEERLKGIEEDEDIEAWRRSFYLITGEDPGTCARCHSAGPFLYTPLLTRLQYKGADIAWQPVPPSISNFEAFRYVVPALDDGRALEVGMGEIDGHDPDRMTREHPVVVLTRSDPLTAKGVTYFNEQFKKRSKELTGAERTSTVTVENQGTIQAGVGNLAGEGVTECLACHFIGKAGNDFYLKGLAINSTGTLEDPLKKRPYQAGFKTLLVEPLKKFGSAGLADVYESVMWMPRFGRRPPDLAGWWDRYLGSKVLLEVCRDKEDHCNFERLPMTDARLPDF